MIVVGIVLVVIAVAIYLLTNEPDPRKWARVLAVVGIALVILAVLLDLLDEEAGRDLDTAVRQFLNV